MLRLKIEIRFKELIRMYLLTKVKTLICWRLTLDLLNLGGKLDLDDVDGLFIFLQTNGGGRLAFCNHSKIK